MKLLILITLILSNPLWMFLIKCADVLVILLCMKYVLVVFFYCMNRFGAYGSGRPVPQIMLWFLQGHHGSFEDTMLWFICGHFGSDMGRISVVHRKHFQELETSIRRLMIYYDMISKWLSIRFTCLFRQYTLHRDLNHMMYVVSYMHDASACVTYWVSYSHIFLHCKGYC